MDAVCVDLFASAHGVVGVWSYDLIDVEEAASEAAGNARLLQGLMRDDEMPADARREMTAGWACLVRDVAAANKVLASRPGGSLVRLFGGEG
ncbi:hypothetical protein GCM10010400_57990 [Streptomyces aculeolatus]|uniref:hypothetical protein n=1 Tax=Streptomyces aculeolatus TaxID=270689 RepID=UPI001CECED0A|nr:hypothetical protein [Streptomyces aculeolatus]